MAFIISKKFKRNRGDTKLYYYLVKNFRDGNKIYRKTLFRLGESSNLLKALSAIRKKIEENILDTEKFQDKLARVNKGDFRGILFFSAPYRTARRFEATIKECKIVREKLRADENKLLGLIDLYPNCSAKDT